MAKKWKLLHRTLKLESKWVTVYADKLLDDNGVELEYWHYDRSDSVVAIVIQGDTFVLPRPQYRVGVGTVMLDFCGSRIDSGREPAAVVAAVIQRELGVSRDAVTSLVPITDVPLAVDSSFSSQKLWGYVVRIDESAKIAKDTVVYRVSEGEQLRQELRCGQCRLLLDEYILAER